MSILACSAGFAVTCPAVQAEDISITENTTWANDDAHAADTTTVSGATLKINHEPVATVGTTYNYGSIHVTNNGTLELETWTGGASDVRDTATGSRPVISSAISLDNSRILFSDGSYEFSGTVTVSGNSSLENTWSKGHVIHTLASTGENAQLTYIGGNTAWGDASPLTLVNEGTFSGRFVMENQRPDNDRANYLVLKDANALGNATTIVDLGSGDYDARNHLAADTSVINLKGLSGKGFVEMNSLTGNSGVTEATVNIINNGESDLAASDVFTGTISSNVTLDASRGTIVIGQITNNGNLVSGDNGKIVIASDHAGLENAGVLDVSGNRQDVGNGFDVQTVTLFTEGSASSTVGGTGKVWYDGQEYSVGDDGVVTLAADYTTYVVMTDNANSTSLSEAKTYAQTQGAELVNVKVLENGVLTITEGAGANGFVSGDVLVNGGGTLVLDAQDSLGWENTATTSITLSGETDKVATMQIGATQTLKTDINLNGNARIDSTDELLFLDAFGSTITVTGTGNIISADIRNRDSLTLDVANAAELNISGTILEKEDRNTSGYPLTGNPAMTKTGTGKVTFSGEGSSFSGRYTQSAGETFFSGANTTLEEGLAINDGRVIADAGDGNTVTITGVTGSGNLAAKSGILKVSGLNTTGLLELGYKNNNVQLGTGKQIIELSGTGNSVRELDASMNKTANGTLLMKQGSTLQVTGDTWLNKDASILLEENAELTTKQGIKIKGTAQAEADRSSIKVMPAANGSFSDQYTAGNTGITITNAIVTSTGSTPGGGNFSLSNILTNSTLVNEGTDTLTVTNGNSTFRGIEARNGNIVVQRWNDTSISVESVLLANDRMLEIWAQNSVGNRGSLTVTQTATFGSGTTLNADLALANGSSLDLGGAVTLGAGNSLTLGSTLGDSITLGDTLKATLNSLAAGGRYNLFITQDVDTITLAGTAYSLTDEAAAMKDLDASAIFSGLEQGAFVLNFDALPATGDGTAGGGVFYITAAMPEPATATLSLLALAALAARRRRK